MQSTTVLTNVTLQKGDDGYWLQFESEVGPAGINISTSIVSGFSGSIIARNIAAWAEEQLKKEQSDE